LNGDVRGVLAAVFPGHQSTSAWAWVLIGAWFGGGPLLVLAVAAAYRLLGESPQEETEEGASGG
jgi:hypothetical protein